MFSLSGSVDFVPMKDSSNVKPYEDLPTILHRAHQWVRQQTGVRVTNVQSINFKVFHPNLMLFGMYIIGIFGYISHVPCIMINLEKCT